MRSLDPPRSRAAGRSQPRRVVAGRRAAPAARRVAESAGARGEPAPAPSRAADGLPEGLQTVMEAMSGFSLADVVVHRNSAEPARLGALAYTKGSEIHLGPGQDQHLPHEAWHVVQQKQGRVRPTMQMPKGISINDNPGLESEADLMGRRATDPWMKPGEPAWPIIPSRAVAAGASGAQAMPIQCFWEKFTTRDWVHFPLLDYYYNAELDGTYYPETGILDYRGESGGFQLLNDDEQDALERRIASGEWTGLWVNIEEDKLYDPKDRMLSSVREPEPGEVVDARTHYDTLLEVARDGGDVDAELREAIGALEDEGEQVPPRQISRGSRVGFEFQELGSEVEITEPPTEEASDGEEDIFDRGDRGQEAYDLALSRRPERIATKFYGTDKGWYVVADGLNLEFVTLPFRSMADLRKTMAEVEYVASVFAEGDFDSSYLLGDTVVRVLKAENQAQPQANPDIPLDSLHNFIADLSQDEDMREELFGVSTGFWNREKTWDEMGLVNDANDVIQGLTDQEVVDVFGAAADASEKRIPTIKGMLQLMANAAIHKFLFHTPLQKDQPILLKTHMGRTWKSMVESKVINKRATSKKVAALLLRACADLEEDENKVSQFVGQVMDGIDPVWGSDKDPDSLDDEHKGRERVLIELRRVPVMPIGEWTEFAISTYQYFITDSAERFS